MYFDQFNASLLNNKILQTLMTVYIPCLCLIWVHLFPCP